MRLWGCGTRVGLNIPQIKLLAIWVGGMHCVIVTKLWGAQIFGVGGFKHTYDIGTTIARLLGSKGRERVSLAAMVRVDTCECVP